jgi:hypothetical protein
MDKIRDLLLDLRIELRSLVKDFQKTDLCRRIDDARSGLTQGGKAAPVLDAVDAVGTDHVAQAWRMAAEDLKVTAPAIYDLLAKKAARHIAARAASSVVAAQAEAAFPEAPAANVPEVAAVDSSPEPVAVVPTEPSPLEPTAVAQAEPEVLLPVAAEPEVDPNMPTRHVLDLIARSKRRFTEAQREWCVGEALVRSGFQIQPNDFLAMGDHAMAKYLLETDSDAQTDA